MPIEIKKLDEIMTLMEKIYGLAVRGLISFDERDALIQVLKQEVTNVLMAGAKPKKEEVKPEKKPKKK